MFWNVSYYFISYSFICNLCIKMCTANNYLLVNSQRGPEEEEGINQDTMISWKETSCRLTLTQTCLQRFLPIDLDGKWVCTLELLLLRIGLKTEEKRLERKRKEANRNSLDATSISVYPCPPLSDCFKVWAWPLQSFENAP